MTAQITAPATAHAKTIARTETPVDTSYAALALAALAGVFLLVASGFAQGAIVHDAAHDQRHAMAFPCH